ncbi:hypothetical protein [Ralstonia insidiosa]|uniref:hypothetical protein n=1 Tax=Ralstonia insidiosa TaxID=190721 RepID=UPI000ABE7EAA|nr:hypothetical protein [Ralstonia insidiosa]
MKLKTLALSAILAITASSSFAGEVTNRIIQSKTFNIGSRESSVPYSEKTANGYKGYSQEICSIIHAEFDKGEILEDRATEEFFEAPATERAKAFLDNLNY